MGAVRHRELVRLLSLLVALNMAVGVVAVAVRSGEGPGRGATQFAGSVGIPLDNENGGVLAGGTFNNRRGPSDPSTTLGTTAPPPSATTASSVPPGSAAPTPSSAAPTPATGRPAATTPSTAVPGTTASTRGSPGTTAATVPPATTATSGRAPDRQGETLTDPVGDTVVDGSADPIKEARADIVRAGAVYVPGTIGFLMQVQKPSDPRTDERWESESTFISWSVDTNGDRTPDFDIQYFVDEGTLAGTVSRAGGDDPEIVCEIPTAEYGPEGYSLSMPASCLGDPVAFTYRVTTYYDTNPKDENADVASDVTPNGGLSKPVNRPN